MAKHTAKRTRNMYPPVYANVVETIVLDDIFNTTTTTTTTEYVYEWKKSAGKSFEFRSKLEKILQFFHSLHRSLKASTRDETRTRTTSFDTKHTQTNKKELKREFRDT